ncbi:MAG: Obg family GTPase CgtA, partial [Clostridia bacterium]|nr:Obg family GTPase CgtA [Clostridia bacterium]
NIGNYHFTTITPVLGVVSMVAGSSFVMADIPGLIEGAADGVGLGHDFLRHVERCRMLVHIVDVAGSEGRDPIADFEAINAELVKFNPEMAKLPQIVAGNKSDLATPEQIDRFRSYVEDLGLPYFSICAPIAEGTQELINAVAAKLATLPPIKRYEAEEIPLEFYEKKKNTGFTVRREDDVFIVEAEWLIPILAKTDMDDYESLQYLQRVIVSSGIEEELLRQGITEGDTVSIYDLEFEFVP